jgi:hypothetical protein
VGDFEIAVGGTTLGVHHSFGNALPVEVSQLVNQLEVADHNRAELACRHRVLVLVQRLTR